MRAPALLAALALLAACSGQGPDVTVASDGDPCRAGQLSGQAGEPTSALDYEPRGPVRVLGPSQPAVGAEEPRRLNLEVDRDGRFLRAYCG